MTTCTVWSSAASGRRARRGYGYGKCPGPRQLDIRTQRGTRRDQQRECLTRIQSDGIAIDIATRANKCPALASYTSEPSGKTGASIAEMGTLQHGDRQMAAKSKPGLPKMSVTAPAGR